MSEHAHAAAPKGDGVQPLRFLSRMSRSPWVCLGSAALGLTIGLNSHSVAEALTPVGEIYMALLSLTVAPIIFSALASGISAMVSSRDGSRYIVRTIRTFILGIFVAGFLGTFVATVALPAFTSLQDREFIGTTLSKFEKATGDGDAGAAEPKSGFWTFVGNFIPSNIVGALASKNVLPIVFLGTLLGLAICHIEPDKRRFAADLVGTIYHTFLTVLEWILYLLPVGLCCLMASQAASVGADAIKAMLAIIILYFVCLIVLGAFYLSAIRKITRQPLSGIWKILKRPYTLALVASAESAIPSTMESMASFGFPKEMLRSVIPLSVAMNRPSTVVIFAITTIFVANIYDVNLTLWQTLFIAMACSVVGAFDSGEYVTMAPMIAYILLPLGLPAAAGTAIIMTIWPLIEWFPELQCIMAATANAAIVGNLADREVGMNPEGGDL